jgi:hypothetical protein
MLGVSYARRTFIVSVEIPHTDKSYSWFLNWMSHRVKDTQQLSINVCFYYYGSTPTPPTLSTFL